MISYLLSLCGGVTCLARRDHAPFVAEKQSRRWDPLPQAKGKITYMYLFEIEITFLLSLSAWIICLTRRDHSPSATIYQSRDWDQILLDISLTVKAATLIFISGCGSAISSAKQGKSGFYL